MRKITGIYLIVLLLASFPLHIRADDQPDKELFEEAKILLFDKDWRDALKKLEEILEDYPESRWYSLALFYKAKCLEELGGREKEALDVYKGYIQLKDRSTGLAEEAERSIIDLAFKLHEKGRRSYIQELVERLSSANRAIKYYAAFKLSYVKDKKIAAKGIPVLQEILDKEGDDELRDRAKIAILRIDPEALERVEEERYEKRAVILKFRVYEKGKKTPKFSLNIPWALADLVFGAIPEEQKTLIKAKGYDVDRIRDELTKFRGNVLVIDGEDITIKMWID